MTRSVVLVFTICLAVYFANPRPQPEVDCVAPPYEAWSLVRRGSLELQRYRCLENLVGYHILELPGGTWVSRRPPGTAAPRSVSSFLSVRFLASTGIML